ncbi:hypothetical protein CTI12_AA624570 [Artemisia annua]|uniref:Uncharacterized protein n=1 Tax=Artemisia annua TaxID=35608 RepID=A0A2U1KAS5_ARTAN|nr:hypothetical protein CTI12_AA624570 [Artemisia annua]
MCIYIIMRSVLGDREVQEIGGVTSLKEKIGFRGLDRVAVDVNLLETLLLCRDRFYKMGENLKGRGESNAIKKLPGGRD